MTIIIEIMNNNKNKIKFKVLNHSNTRLGHLYQAHYFRDTQCYFLSCAKLIVSR